MLLGTRAVPAGAVQRGNSSGGLLPLHPSAYCASTGCFSLFLTCCVSTRLCPVLPGRGELPLPRPRVPPCAVANPPHTSDLAPAKGAGKWGCWRPPPPSSASLRPGGPPPRGTRCVLLLLPLFLTHFMTEAQGYKAQHTPGARSGRRERAGSTGVLLCDIPLPCLAGDAWRWQGQRLSPRGCAETLTGWSQSAAGGKAKLKGAIAEGGDAEPLRSHPALPGDRRRGPGGPTLRKWK